MVIFSLHFSIHSNFSFNANTFCSIGYEEDVRIMKINLSAEQIKSIMDAHFNMKCDFCDTVFDGIKTARPHYLKQHNIRFGYIKCCNIKLRHNQIVLDHIQWHIDPDTFR